MRNQFDQDIQVGDWVGHAQKTGSTTERRVGQVTKFGERATWHGVEDVAYVTWLRDGTWKEPAKAISVLGKGVGITRLFKLDPTGLES